METLKTLAIVTLINHQVGIKTLPSLLQKAVLNVGSWLTTISRDEKNLKEIINRLKTPEICLAIVSCNGLILDLVPDHLRTPAVCLEAVTQNGLLLYYVPDHLKTPAVCLVAVARNGNALRYVPERLMTREMCLAAVTRCGHALKYVPNNLKTYDICLAAVKENEYTAWDHVPYDYYLVRRISRALKRAKLIKACQIL